MAATVEHYEPLVDTINHDIVDQPFTIFIEKVKVQQKFIFHGIDLGAYRGISVADLLAKILNRLSGIGLYFGRVRFREKRLKQSNKFLLFN